MIRVLGEEDRPELVRLLNQAPAYNLYQLGNQAVVGFAQPYCTFYGDFGDAGRLRASANRYMTGWGAWGEADADWPAIAALIDQDAEAARLQDNPGGIASLLPLLTREIASSEEEQMMILHASDFHPQATPEGLILRRASRDDVDDLVALYAAAGDMRRSRESIERPLAHGVFIVGRLSGKREGQEGELVAAALTNAMTEDSAMIGGVFTRHDQRGRGFSQAVCSVLCATLLEMGRTPSLYWKTPSAGRVYRKLGFTPMGVWRSVWLGPLRETHVRPVS